MLTACGNDYGYDRVFERPLRGLGRRGDVLFGITTSGRSLNVVRALQAAREMGIVTVGLLGGTGEPALAACDHVLLVPDTETARIQECHIALGHAVLELLEDRLVARPLVRILVTGVRRLHRLPRRAGAAGPRRHGGRGRQPERLLRRAAEAGAAGAACGRGRVSASPARHLRARGGAALGGRAPRHPADRASGGAGWRAAFAGGPICLCAART